VSSSPEAKDAPRTITDVTRREIIDHFAAGNVGWSGRLEEDAFLARLYDLQRLPSDDYRFPNAAGDIWKHRVVNHDWVDDWVFYDHRFNFMRCPDEEFLRFLCETVHPVVRPDADDARGLVAELNRMLANDGWELVEHKQISGRPVFAAHQIGGRIDVFDEPTGWPKVERQIGEVREQLRGAANEEQFQAVGLLCREALISVAQAVYVAERHPTLDGVAASNTDAKRMLEAFIAVEFAGGANEEARSYAKASLRLALALQHDRTADFRAAALCAEATVSVINLIGVISGARSPSIKAS
jgi:AbiJ N-terminal domain 3